MIFYCARPLNPQFDFKGSLVDPPLRASNEHIPIVRVPRARGRSGYPSHPSKLARCPFRGGADGSSIARVQRGESATARCASTEDPSASTLKPPTFLPSPPLIRKGSGRGCPLLRASNEHILIVRVLRARRAPRRSPLPFSTSSLSATRHVVDERPVDIGATNTDGIEEDIGIRDKILFIG